MRTRLNDCDSEVTNLCNTPGLAEHLHRCSGTPPPPRLRTHVIKRLRSMSALHFMWWRFFFCPHIVPKRSVFSELFSGLRFIKMIGAEIHFKGLGSGGQLLQPPTVIPLKPPIVCICAVRAHMAPPPPHPVSALTCGAHGYTSNIWSFYLFFCFLLCHLYFMGHICFQCNLSSERRWHSKPHKAPPQRYFWLNPILIPLASTSVSKLF